MTRKERHPLGLYPQAGETGEIDLASVPLTPLEVASYVESMTLELKAMARAAKLDTLCYFLDMARMEAVAQVERLEPKASGRRRSTDLSL